MDQSRLLVFHVAAKETISHIAEIFLLDTVCIGVDARSIDLTIRCMLFKDAVTLFLSYNHTSSPEVDLLILLDDILVSCWIWIIRLVTTWTQFFIFLLSYIEVFLLPSQQKWWKCCKKGVWII